MFYKQKENTTGIITGYFFLLPDTMHGIYFTSFFKISLGKKHIDNVLNGKLNLVGQNLCLSPIFTANWAMQQKLEASYRTLDMYHRPGASHNNTWYLCSSSLFLTETRLNTLWNSHLIMQYSDWLKVIQMGAFQDDNNSHFNCLLK